MILNLARHKLGQAMAGTVGTPLAAGRRLDWPTLKRLVVITVATVVLVVLVSSLDGPRRGAGPLLVAAVGLLVAILDLHRHDKRVFGLLLAILPLAMLAAWAASDTPLTAGATDQATVLGNQASMSGASELTELAGRIGSSLPDAMAWAAAKGKEIVQGVLS